MKREYVYHPCLRAVVQIMGEREIPVVVDTGSLAGKRYCCWRQTLRWPLAPISRGRILPPAEGAAARANASTAEKKTIRPASRAPKCGTGKAPAAQASLGATSQSEDKAHCAANIVFVLNSE